MKHSAANHGRRGRPWRRIRAQVLERDPYCTIRLPGCTRYSTTVDHIVPLSRAPWLAHEPTNLRGACRHCNSAGGGAMTTAKMRARKHGAQVARQRSTRLTW